MVSQKDQKDELIGRIFGTCKIEKKIAVGGFGTVYKAIDDRLEIPRAVKIFHPHLSQKEDFIQRFSSEIRDQKYQIPYSTSRNLWQG